MAHDEAARFVAFRAAEDLAGDELDAEALFAPAGRIAGVHDASRRLAAAIGAEPGVGFERVRVVVDETERLVRRRDRLGEDVDERPARVREMDRTGAQARDRIA